MRILLVGDTHGNANALDGAFWEAKEDGCELIIQLGDFGAWTHTKWGAEFSVAAGEMVKDYGIPLWWCDGNHEAFSEIIEEIGMDTFNAGRDPVKMSNGTFYLPRGCRFTLGETSFLVMGGAHSIDKAHRVNFISWWPQEEITDHNVEWAIAAGHADVMLTHDLPEKALVACYGQEGADAYPQAKANTHRLQQIVDAVKPTMLIHGHAHRSYETTIQGDDYECLVKGLNKESDPGSTLVFQTAGHRD